MAALLLAVCIWAAWAKQKTEMAGHMLAADKQLAMRHQIGWLARSPARGKADFCCRVADAVLEMAEVAVRSLDPVD